MRAFWTLGMAVVLVVSLFPSMPISIGAQADQVCFDTGHCLSGRFRSFWEQNGGTPVFGWPIGPVTPGTPPAQWLQRHRFEHHPGNAAPYDVLLARVGAIGLEQQKRDWAATPRSAPQPGCLYFEQTGRNVCDQAPGLGFKTYWETHGLLDPALDPYRRSLALFGLPLTEPALETNKSGATVLTQWFERARFEWHPGNEDAYKVLLGLLGDELRPLVDAPAPLPVPAGETVTVTRVVDGDTIHVNRNGVDTTVRLIGVDTPESVAPNQPVECFGREASEFTKAQLTGKTIVLEKDVSETDRFGRLLRYVWLDGTLFNETLVREGYAQVSTFPPDVKYVERFRAAQVAAREANRGLWGACQAPAPTPTATRVPQAPPPSTSSCPSLAVPGNSDVQVTAAVSNSSPPQRGNVTVCGRIFANGQPVAGVPMSTTWQYKSSTPVCTSQSDTSGLAICTRDIGAATIGYEVVIRVVFTYQGREYVTSTSFTPR